jgi:transcriptional regulator with XRE-family HTH domain
MSQTDLSEALGITLRQFQKYEKGLERPEASRLQQIAAALGVSPGYFFEGMPTVAKTTPAPKKEFMSKASIGPSAVTVVDIWVGQKIRARRMLLGKSQTELADALGITFQQIQKYEKGTERVGASRLIKIGDALGVSVSYFFEGSQTV